MKINAPLGIVWDYWVNPIHIIRWSSQTEKFKSLNVDIDFRIGGSFHISCITETDDSSFSISGRFGAIKTYKQIEYLLSDKRVAAINFKGKNGITLIQESVLISREKEADYQDENWVKFITRFKNYLKNIQN